MCSAPHECQYCVYILTTFMLVVIVCLVLSIPGLELAIDIQALRMEKNKDNYFWSKESHNKFLMRSNDFWDQSILSGIWQLANFRKMKLLIKLFQNRKWLYPQSEHFETYFIYWQNISRLFCSVQAPTLRQIVHSKKSLNTTPFYQTNHHFQFLHNYHINWVSN